ncbi:MAG: SDR family oxidoreductase [Micromonosporaceae bacterium]
MTGSASGIGAAVRVRLEAAGDRVIGVDLRDAEVIADLSGRPGRTAACEAITAACRGRLDALVACAGVGPHVPTPELIPRVGYFGTVELLDALLGALAAGRQPCAVVITSNSAGIIPPDQALLEALIAGNEEAAAQAAAALDGATVYGVTKRALTYAVRHRAGPWGARGVRLNAVAPGPVETPLLQATLDDPVLGPLTEALTVPLGRRAAPREIAHAVAFLLDPASAYIHGSVLFVDGGTDATMRPGAI